MKTIRIFFLIFLLDFFFGCNQQNDNTLMLDKQISLELHETRYAQTEGISLRFDSILSDSRCPLNVNCIWAGNAAVQFTFTKSGIKNTLILNTLGSTYFPKDTLISGYQIRLLEFLPYPTYPETSSKTPEAIVSVTKL